MAIMAIIPLAYSRCLCQNEWADEARPCIQRASLNFVRSIDATGATIFKIQSGNGTVFFQEDRIVFALRNDDSKGASGVAQQQNEYEAPRKLRNVFSKTDDYKLVNAVFQNMEKSCRLEGWDEVPETQAVFRVSPSTSVVRDIQFSRICYRNIYPGTDLLFYCSNGNLEYEYIVYSWADTGRVHLACSGGEINGVRTLEELLTNINAQTITLAPERNHYEREGNRKISAVSPSAYTRFYGSDGGEGILGITIGKNNLIYISGSTTSLKLPNMNDSLKSAVSSDWDSYIMIISPNGDSVLSTTIIGGSGNEAMSVVALDSNGNVYLSLFTDSRDFPTSAGAFQKGYGGGEYDGAVVKMDPLCRSIVYSTYIGGNAYDEIWGMTVDTSGCVYITGLTDSENYPITAKAFQTSYAGGEDDVFVTKLRQDGVGLVYSTYLGGQDFDEAYSIQTDGKGCAVICGFSRGGDYPTTANAYAPTPPGYDDGFVTKLNSEGSSLEFSTYLGGDDNGDYCLDVALDSNGGVFITGETVSSNFPTTKGVVQEMKSQSRKIDAFVSRLDSSGAHLLSSTFYGNKGSVNPRSITRNNGTVFIGGTASDGTFPVSTGQEPDTIWGIADAIVIAMKEDLTRLYYSNLFGGDSSEGVANIAVSGTKVIVAGTSNSAVFHSSNGTLYPRYGGRDGMLIFLNLDEITTSVPAAESMKDIPLLQPYPNPVHATSSAQPGIILLPYRSGRGRGLSIQIYDHIGRKVEEIPCLNEQAGTSHARLDVSRYAAGVYYYHVTGAEGMQGGKFVVVN
jgi:hypothetical protein